MFFYIAVGAAKERRGERAARKGIHHGDYCSTRFGNVSWANHQRIA